VRATKRSINHLCEIEGTPIPFPEADREDGDSPTIGSMRRDEFYGVALATAIRRYLEMRRSSGMGPATVQDMYEALVAGGFRFETKNTDNAKRGLYISLAKNTAVFHKLPGGDNDQGAIFGLLEWYPNAKLDDDWNARKGKRSKPSRKQTRRNEPEPSNPPSPKELPIGRAGAKPEKGRDTHEER